MTNSTCNNCGWVHFTVTREYAEQQVIDFNAYYDALSPADQQSFYGGRKPSVQSYEHCFRCNNTYKDFRPSEPGDCPDGCTIQPIIQE